MACNLTDVIPLSNTGLKSWNTATSTYKPNKITDASGQISASNRTLQYFKNLNKTVIQNLFNIFKPDFEMFQYSKKGFLYL